MSIVPLRRVTLYGLLAEKAQVLRDLQELGCLQLVALREGLEEETTEGPSPDARNALKYLLACRQRRLLNRDPIRARRQSIDQAHSRRGRQRTEGRRDARR